MPTPPDDIDALLGDILAATPALKPGQGPSRPVPAGPKIDLVAEAGDSLSQARRWVRTLDAKLNAQLNEILHHPDFRRLEATWRALHRLVEHAAGEAPCQVRVLPVTRDELAAELAEPERVESTALFRKLDDPYHTVGAAPFGLLICGEEFDHSGEDVQLLKGLAHIGAGLQISVLAGAKANLCGTASFRDLPTGPELHKRFARPDHAAWNSFRQMPQARFVALAAPGVLARPIYSADGVAAGEFYLAEAADPKGLPWASGAWLLAGMILEQFHERGWFGDLANLLAHGWPTAPAPADDGDIALAAPSEAAFTDKAAVLAEHGVTPLRYVKPTGFRFAHATSAQKPPTYHDAAAQDAARVGARLDFQLCVSRFAVALGMLARQPGLREKFLPALHKLDRLQNWVRQYVLPEDAEETDAALVAQPLSDAVVEVRAIPARNPKQVLTMHLVPLLDLEETGTAVVTWPLVPPR